MSTAQGYYGRSPFWVSKHAPSCDPYSSSRRVHELFAVNYIHEDTLEQFMHCRHCVYPGHTIYTHYPFFSSIEVTVETKQIAISVQVARLHDRTKQGALPASYEPPERSSPTSDPSLSSWSPLQLMRLPPGALLSAPDR
jgi:hypothetical protein